MVDDESPDGTGTEVAYLARGNNRIHLLSRKHTRSYATAIMDGFKQALAMGAKRIFTMDADHSHNPEDLIKIDKQLDYSPMVIGSRYIGGIRILNWSLRRLALSLAANYYIRFLLRLQYTDCTSGFRGYRRELGEELIRYPAKSHGYSFLVDMLYLVHQAGYRIEEVPIIYTERRAGQSKMRRRTILEAALRPWLIILSKLRRQLLP